MADDQVSSASDRRVEVTNNIMRHNYRRLSPIEQERMLKIKDKGLELVTLLHELGGTDPNGERLASRELALAQTKAEEAVMWAVKHLTK